MAILLRFWIKYNNTRSYIEALASQDHGGGYVGRDEIYLRDCYIPRQYVDGPIEEVWINEDEEENGEAGTQPKV